MRLGTARRGRRIALAASVIGLTAVAVAATAPAALPRMRSGDPGAAAVVEASRTGTTPSPSAPADAAPVPAAGTAPVFDGLPVGAPPTAVPYAIGTRVYYNGRIRDLDDRFTAAFPGTRPAPAQRQFTAVVAGDGVAWTQFIGSGADVVEVVGRVDARGGYTPFHVSTGRLSTLAVTTRGIVTMPENGQAYRADGRFLGAFTGSANIDCGSCAPSAAGYRVVIDQWSGPSGRPEHQGTWLWYPPDGIQRIDDRFRAVGRLGTGWLGLQLDRGCWQLAPATEPAALGARFCSLTTPLVSPDGTRVVVVQAGRLRVLDPRTAAPLGVATMPALTGWSLPRTTGGPARYLVPAAWVDDETYVVTARVDDVLALLTCSVRTGACRRTVRVLARPGVDRIVTERGLADVLPTAG